MHTVLYPMKTLLALLLALPLAAAEPNTLSPQEKEDGWKLLFNGENLEGWRKINSQDGPGPGWKVENGILMKVSGARGGDIITTDKFTDYELSWEWNLAPKGNNGIKYMVVETRSAPGPEYQMLDDHGHHDAKNGPKRQNAALYDILPPAEDKPNKPPGEWNLSRIIVKGDHVEHWLNGAKVLQYTLGSPELIKAISASKFAKQKDFGMKTEGHIMITDHQDQCSFRNIKIRPLN
jgi:hypothetical protein